MKTHTPGLSLLRVVWCLLLAAPSTQALTYYVARTGNDANPGTQALPVRTIQRAINLADTTQLHTIIVAAGEYAENITWTGKNLAVRGAGAGASIINGGGVGTCLRLTDVPATASLEGFTIGNGRANDTDPDAGGGGMRNQRSNLLVKQCAFVSNSALVFGGGMLNLECTNLTLIACTFVGNRCGDGGGMENRYSSPLLFSCLFSGNSSTFSGGGMVNYRSSPRLVHCTFNGNQAMDGGGLFTYDGPGPALTNCIIWGNPGGEVVGAATLSHSDVLGGYPGIGNLSADPQFVRNPGTLRPSDPGDLHLQSTSPCRNSGVTSVTDHDLEWTPRPMESGYDMGAYEFRDAPVGYWYVDAARGNDADSNSGTPTSPLATVTKAITQAVNGNRIYVKQGNYGSDRPRITKAVQLFNWGDTGLARIGQP
jgi:hypothetical protein